MMATQLMSFRLRKEEVEFLREVQERLGLKTLTDALHFVLEVVKVVADGHAWLFLPPSFIFSERFREMAGWRRRG